MSNASRGVPANFRAAKVLLGVELIVRATRDAKIFERVGAAFCARDDVIFFELVFGFAAVAFGRRPLALVVRAFQQKLSPDALFLRDGSCQRLKTFDRDRYHIGFGFGV